MRGNPTGSEFHRGAYRESLGCATGKVSSMGNWRDNRPAGHDELVATCLAQMRGIVTQLQGPDQRDPDEVIVEAPCKSGFADLLMTWYSPNLSEEVKDAMELGVLDRPRYGFIIEVKSEREVWSAGDVIRQLKRYQKEIPSHFWKINGSSMTNKPYGMALFSGRPVAEVERTLLNHERVKIIKL